MDEPVAQPESGGFRCSLTLRHPSCDPAEITRALGLKPFGQIRAGDVVDGRTMRRTLWMAEFRRGKTNDEYAVALEDFLNFLDRKQEFLLKMRGEEGEIELGLSEEVGWQQGVLFRLTLEPYFLAICGENEVGLRVEAFSMDSQAETTPLVSEAATPEL